MELKELKNLYNNLKNDLEDLRRSLWLRKYRIRNI